MSKNVLVIAAHPDDEILGCGGTIAKHYRGGDKVRVVIVADGVTSRFYSPGMQNVELNKIAHDQIETRKNELYEAAKIIGLQKDDIHYFGLPDQRLDQFPLLDIVKKIEYVAQDFPPNIVYTHHWGDLNKDHRVCCEATITAFRKSRQISKEAESIYCYEIPGNIDVLPPKAVNNIKPNHFVDITISIQLKLEALRAYKSELREYPASLSPQSVFELSEMRAKNKDFKHAEVFEILRQGGIS
ncbi:MAG: PIG-L deacetylase family protein [Candidatus Margulisiibacteriota bacterium]|nr:PIG-L deacetylase family protein [Candidatus Margulisiibacteriota bacterium]